MLSSSVQANTKRKVHNRPIVYQVTGLLPWEELGGTSDGVPIAVLGDISSGVLVPVLSDTSDGVPVASDGVPVLDGTSGGSVVVPGGTYDKIKQ